MNDDYYDLWSRMCVFLISLTLPDFYPPAKLLLNNIYELEAQYTFS